MTKSIIIMGATNGIGLVTALELATAEHSVLLHGRSAEKLGWAAASLP